METYIVIFLTISWIIVARLWVDKFISAISKPIQWPGGNIDGGVGEVVVSDPLSVKINEAVRITVDDKITEKAVTKKAGKKRGRKKKNQV